MDVDVATVEVTTMDDESVIRGRIWNDLDEDGVRDANESYVNGQGVDLMTLDGTLIATATTASLDLDESNSIEPELEDGWYSFEAVVSGDYVIRQRGIGTASQTFPASDTMTAMRHVQAMAGERPA